MHYLITCLLIVSTGSCLSQTSKDYLKFRDAVFHPVCGWRDSLTAAEVTVEMLGVDTTLIRKNKDIYYEDLSMVQYQWFAYTGDTAMLRSSVLNSEKAIACNPKSGSLWEAAFTYQKLGDCVKSMHYLGLYETRVNKKHQISREQIDLLRAKCGDR